MDLVADQAGVCEAFELKKPDECSQADILPAAMVRPSTLRRFWPPVSPPGRCPRSRSPSGKEFRWFAAPSIARGDSGRIGSGSGTSPSGRDGERFELARAFVEIAIAYTCRLLFRNGTSVLAAKHLETHTARPAWRKGSIVHLRIPWSPLAVTAAAAAGALCASRDALASGPLDLEVAATAGYGTSPFAGDPVNQFGAEVGVRAGIVFRNVYVGGTFMSYLGNSSADFRGGGLVPAGSNEASGLTGASTLYGGEVGYDFELWRLTLRPELGVGALVATSQGNNATSILYLEPGLAGFLQSHFVVLGADMGVLFQPGMSSMQPAFTVHGQIGLRF